MTVQELPGAAAYRPTPPPAWKPITDPAPLLPDPEPYRVLGTDAVADVDPELLLRLHAELVRGRRYNAQATALTKQGGWRSTRRAPVRRRARSPPPWFWRSATGSSRAIATRWPPSRAAWTRSRR